MVLLLALLLALPAFAADTTPVTFAPTSLNFVYQLGSFLPSPQGVAIVSPSPGNFTASRPIDQQWVLISDRGPNTLGAYPVFLTVVADPTGLGPGRYTSAVTIRTPAGTQSIPVSLQVMAATVMLASPGIIGFDLQQYPPGVMPLQTVAIGSSNPMIPLLLVATTTTPWLAVTRTGSTVQVSVDRSKAPPGVATGSFSVAANGFPRLDVPVILMNEGFFSAPPLTITPTGLTFNGSGSQGLTVNATAATDFLVSATAQSGQGNWLTVDTPVGTTRSGVSVCADGTNLAAGTYQGTVSFSANGAVQTVPVSLQTAAPTAPTITRLVNAATFQEGSVAPGEIITLGGTGLGPACLVGLLVQPDGRVATKLGDTQVLFNGIPAPLIYASSNQISAVVPYEMANRTTTDIQVVTGSRASNTITSPVVASAPGIFTSDSSGRGPGAILNPNNSVNSPANPVSRGSVVVLYVTGEGQTNPDGVTGKVTTVSPVPPITPAPRLQVTATVDGRPAKVAFAGQAPTFVSGVLQVNLEIPVDARTGDLPVVVQVGTTSTQAAVTVSVK